MAPGPPGGTLAITTWGPRMFEPGSTVWRESLQKLQSNLYSDFNPWERITELTFLLALLSPTSRIRPARAG
jgi:hypothetical protein